MSKIQIQIQIRLFDIILQNETWIDTFILHLTLVSYPWLNFQVVGMGILIKARSRCRNGHHKGRKEEFSIVIREAPIFPNYCMENCGICLVGLARSISVVFDLISLCIKRRPVSYCYTLQCEWKPNIVINAILQRSSNQKLNDDNSNKQYENGHKHCTNKIFKQLN